MTYGGALSLPMVMRRCPKESSPRKLNSFCSVCAFAPRAVSNSILPALDKLCCCTKMCFKQKNAASQPSQTSVSSQVRAAHTGLLSLSKKFFTSSCVETDQALPTSRYVLFCCSSLMLKIGLSEARSSFSRKQFFSVKAERISFKSSPTDCWGRVSGQCRISIVSPGAEQKKFRTL